jgi:hypothetical protein
MANVIQNVLASAPYFEVLPSVARIAAPDTVEVVVDRRGFNPNALILTIDVTAVTDTPALTVTISRVDRVSGKLTTVLASAAIATVSTVVLKVGPDLAGAANSVALDYVPSVFRITCAHGDADSITYSVGGMFV